MAALETTTGFVTAPSTTVTAVTVSQGTLTVRQFNQGRAWLVDFFRNGQAAGYGALISPKMHDQVYGIRVRAGIGTQQLLPWGFPQQMFSQDTLNLSDTGSATGGDIENIGYTVLYEQPTGPNANLIDLDTLEARQQAFNLGPTLYGLNFSLAGHTDGTYSATTALNAGVQGAVLKANTDYAVLGAFASETAVMNASNLTIQGPGTGNYTLSIPMLGQFSTSGSASRNMQEYFVQMTKSLKAPCIPVVNAADAGGTFISVLNNENANTVIATLLLAPLG